VVVAVVLFAAVGIAVTTRDTDAPPPPATVAPVDTQAE
jgi:hypothetical protein